jgi:LysM repeat protein
LVFGLAGGIWYWQGTYENEVVSDSLIPAKPSAKTNPPPPPSGPTELDMMEIKVESSVQKERIGRIDGADGFKVRKDGLSDLYIKAVAYENAKSWSNAAINYTNYVEGCKALLALNNERNLADKNRKIAEAAKVGAEGADSAKYVSVQWNEALANAKIAGEKFAAMEFAKASHLYEKAAGQFLECELNAKKESERLKKEQEQREVALREKERLAAVAARSFALKESKRAEDAGAKEYAVKSWNRIVDEWKMADALLQEKRFAEAKNKFDGIAKAYADCIEETQRAKIARERQVLEALATNPGKVLKKDLFTPKLKKYEWIYTEILRVQGELSALLGTFTEEVSEVQEKRKEFNELLEQFVELMEKDGLGDKARKALKSWAGSEGVIEKPSSDEPSYFIYEVKSGDSLDRIAQKYQITVTEIIKVNKIRSNFFRLWVCQKLKIPINKSVSNKSVSKVQLWEGGPYWADRNIGAEKPEDYGYYFWWGDTIGYKREGDKWVASDGSNTNFSFSKDNTPTYDKSFPELESEGWIEKKNGTYTLTSKHDAAQAHLGGAWRMPTRDEFDNLVEKCDWTWTTRNGKNGYVVRGRGNYASKSIFLPAVGHGNRTSLNNAGSLGYYWSSVPYSGSYCACSLFFYSGDHSTDYYNRLYGQSVRPLQGFTK